MNQEETLNINQIKFNQLLLDAHNQFQLRDLNQAIRLYEEALNCQEAGRGNIKSQLFDIDRMAIILANLGIIYFHNCDYKQATEKLLQAFNMIDRKNDFICALLIKILGNLAIIKLITTEYQECKDYNDQAIQLIIQAQPPLQYQLFKELMYIYYRFQSFEAMGDGNFENLEQKYDGQSLACFYSSMGLNRELCGDMTLAFRYHQKALKLWQEQKENGFTVITLRRILTIAQNERMDCKDYVQQLQKCMQSPELRRISPEILFKDCEKKLQCAREITTSLQKLEQQLNYQKNQQLLSQPLTVKQQDEFWKLALKLRLKRAIQFCYHQMTQQEAENVPQLSQSIAQLEHQLKLLDQQQPYENYLQNLPFTKESVNIIKSHLMKFNRICLKIQLEPFLNYLYQLKQEVYQDQQNYQQPQFKQKFQSNQMYNQQIQYSNTLGQQKQFDQMNSQYNSQQSQINYDYQNQQNFQSYHSTNDQQNYMVKGQNPTSQQNNQYQQYNNPLSSNFSQKNQLEQNDFQQQKQQTLFTNNYDQQPFKNTSQFGSQTMGFAGNNQQKTQNQQLSSSQQQQQQQQANLKLTKSQLNQPQTKQGQMMAVSMTKSQKLKNVSLLNAAYRTVMLGDQLTKCNKSSNGRIERFFILANDGTFRWAQNSKHINDPKSVNSYSVSDIRGLLYGKVTDVLRKSYNNKLEPWLCFSLVMKTRSMDFHTQELQINSWVIAMSEEIKRRNPSAFVITAGRMLWRKMKLILHWYFVNKKKKDKKKRVPPNTFAHLLYLYAKKQCRLPQIK
ncbi:unnamed protein product (macronuclear) [Paramecium tetraurelia]|uniref:PH domain-containing protein n=1 Tax=Paramecium tetraurelia TaxID=5888 RepID=A0DB55_PARTE|nr:uncharacterized protein GSPATT00015166001 [Paramecium tetraurelia]CAK80272.1 unnamed protein product [Paramecium tetraurelia]|eukprot:XP_001447669.1 hypothetical protein (macronuclear) [Paramecium tetraurelia strain d4-2]